MVPGQRRQLSDVTNRKPENRLPVRLHADGLPDDGQLVPRPQDARGHHVRGRKAVG